MVGQIRRPAADGNSGSTLEAVAALLMDAVGMLQEEIDKRKKRTGDGDDDTTRADRPDEDDQRGR